MTEPAHRAQSRRARLLTDTEPAENPAEYIFAADFTRQFGNLLNSLVHHMGNHFGHFIFPYGLGCCFEQLCNARQQAALPLPLSAPEGLSPPDSARPELFIGFDECGRERQRCFLTPG